MSKRPYYPQNYNDRKKAKLDVTISDHNFPLSQNGPNKDIEQDNWGDDNDDEILLLASQACEDAYNDMSSLPDYSLCMQPTKTSTQLFDPGPSTSKSTFNFKKPSAMPPSAVSSHLKDKCNRISSPLPGISSKVIPNEEDLIDLTDNLIFSDKIFKGQDSDVLYKQLLQLQEENTKLKSENGKLLEKCVTKEGEASILRTQLKTGQIAVDNARMEKIKAQEKAQMEWTEKLAASNKQMHELRTQLDFKNLEIISIKERCKLLESNKIKLTQVTVPNNDISSSQRINKSFTTKDASLRKAKVASSSVQTDDRAHFLKLNTTCRSDTSNLTAILPLILEPTANQPCLLEFNDKLQKHTDSTRNKCRVYSTFHRIPSNGAGVKEVKSSMCIGSVYEDLTNIAAGTDDGKALENILSLFKRVLRELECDLSLVSRKVTTAFHKEMDERYIEATNAYPVVNEQDLLSGRPLFKEEQAVLARRVTSVVAWLARIYSKGELLTKYVHECVPILEIITNICSLLDSTSCALLYSGFILSTANLLPYIQVHPDAQVIQTLRHMISSRPMPFVCSELLKVLRQQSLKEDVLRKLCPKSSAGNLRLDYDQGVLLYKKDSCFIQVLLKQIETSLKCMERQNLTQQAMDITTQLIAVYSNGNQRSSVVHRDQAPGCECQLTSLQVIVYSLRILAVMCKASTTSNVPGSQLTSTRLLAVCRSGTHILYQCALRDVEFSSQLGHNEGHLLEFCELMKSMDRKEPYVSMLSELSSAFQSSPEDATSCFQRDPWAKSFRNFSITD